MSPGAGPAAAAPSPDEQPSASDDADPATTTPATPSAARHPAPAAGADHSAETDRDAHRAAAPGEGTTHDENPADRPELPDGPATAPGASGGGPGAPTGPAGSGGGDREEPEPPAPDDTERVSTFSSLRIRNYRIFFLGSVVSNTGTWMQRIAQDWLVHSLTGSAAAVGITTALQFLPMLLFGLYGGVLADRLDKRKLLLCTQSAIGLTGLVLAALTLSGNVEVTHIYLLAFLLGVCTVVDNPARQTFVAEMVGPKLLRNAVSLNSANFQTARIIGPTMAGFVIAAVGSGYAFLFNGLSFIAPVVGLLLMRTTALSSPERAPRGKGQLRAGLRYVGSRPELLWPIVLIGFLGTFGFNFPIWLVAYTDGVFDAGAGTYGALNALMAVGSLTGALIAARWGRSRARYLVASSLLFGAFLILLAGAPTLWMLGLLIVPTGLIGMTVMITGNTSLQLASDPAMRGRVMSLYMMVFLGGTPFGGPLMGWITDTHGPRIGLLAGGLLCAVPAVVIGVVLARIGGLRVAFTLRRGRPHLAFVPREPRRPVPPVTVARSTVGPTGSDDAATSGGVHHGAGTGATADGPERPGADGAPAGVPAGGPASRHTPSTTGRGPSSGAARGPAAGRGPTTGRGPARGPTASGTGRGPAAGRATPRRDRTVGTAGTPDDQDGPDDRAPHPSG